MTNQVKNYFKVYVKDNKGLKKIQLIPVLGMCVCTYTYVCIYTFLNKSYTFTFTLRTAICLAWFNIF